MSIGFVGSGNMARAIALGLREPALFCDSGSGRAAALADETGGEAADVKRVADESDVLFLCHKPAQLDAVAERIGDYEGVLASVLAATPLEALRAAYPHASVVRLMPNTPAEHGAGVTCVAAESDLAPELETLLERLGQIVRLPEAEIELATAIGGCAPAFFALFARELIAAATTRGMAEDVARRIVGQTLLGTGVLLDANGVDADAAMRAVASPGGLTERALASFAATGLPESVARAVATVLGEDS